MTEKKAKKNKPLSTILSPFSLQINEHIKETPKKVGPTNEELLKRRVLKNLRVLCSVDDSSVLTKQLFYNILAFMIAIYLIVFLEVFDTGNPQAILNNYGMFLILMVITGHYFFKTEKLFQLSYILMIVGGYAGDPLLITIGLFVVVLACIGILGYEIEKIKKKTPRRKHERS